MASPRKYDQEFRDRAVRMYSERLAEPGESKRGARRHVGVLLDLNPETLRNWAEERDRVESGRSPAPPGSIDPQSARRLRSCGIASIEGAARRRRRRPPAIRQLRLLSHLDESALAGPGQGPVRILRLEAAVQ